MFSGADSSPLEGVLQDTLLVFMSFLTDLSIFSDLRTYTESLAQESALDDNICGNLNISDKVAQSQFNNNLIHRCHQY